jgi:hypothetical protein
MRILGSVVEALVLTMLDAGHDLPLGRRVALELVGDPPDIRPYQMKPSRLGTTASPGRIRATK